MKALKKMMAVLAALVMMAGVAVLPVQNMDTVLIACAEEGTYGALTYINYGDYIEITGFNETTATVNIPPEIEGLPVTSIGTMAFYWCKGVKKLTIPDSITSIGTGAFLWCEGLTEVTIPDSVTSIGDEAFEYCTSLTAITIPDSVTSIGVGTFFGCESLTAITIPNRVESIGGGAFASCKSLTEIRVEEGNASYTSIGGVLYHGTELAAYPCGKPESSFVIPNSVTSVGPNAFRDCAALTAITIPSSVASIGGLAFRNCDNLTNVYYSGSEAQWNAMEIADTNESLLNASIHFNYNSSDSNTPTYGDVDENGTIDLLDVILLNKNLMIGTVLSEQGKANADVDKNGQINAVDSLNILKYAVKLITLPVE